MTTSSATVASPDEPAADVRRKPPWRRLFWTWLAFWLLLFVLGAQEYLWSGGRELWRPFVDLGTAALVATALAIVQIRRSPRFDHLLAQPARWFLHMWAWLPLQLVAFIAAMELLRLIAYSLAGQRYPSGWRLEVLAYEAFKFFLYYALLGGIQFGQRSYRAWATERLRTEQQARLAQQAQLAQLTQQLQPHFLFNALNTVSSLIHSDPDLADVLLTRLATLLRAATDASQRPEQPLVKELALLHAYADIMTQRFADRVAIRWDVDVGAEHCSVPTLGLQPLIENCFRHVVAHRRELTHVVVRAMHGTGTLRVEVEDDGDLHEPCRRCAARRPGQSRASAAIAARRAGDPELAPAAGRRPDRRGGAAVRALIVDDEAPARHKLRRMLGAFADVEVVGEAADGGAALSLAATLQPDVIFLDVQMPEVDGFDVAASLPDDGPALVFVTAFDRHALKAFDTRACDFLLKPVEPERLGRALERLRAGARPAVRPGAGVAPAQLLIVDRGATHVVRVADIEWLQSADNYVHVHLGARSLLMRRTLEALLGDLGPAFARTHRSAAVALARVQSLRPRGRSDVTVVLQSGAEVPCSRQHRAALVQHLQRQRHTSPVATR